MALSIRQMQGEIQRALNTRVDYDFGRHSWNSLFLELVDKEKINFPYAIKAFGEWLIIADPFEAKPFDPNGPLSKYPMSVSGSFSFNGAPISILIYKDEIMRPYSCHYWCGFPESVLCFYEDGTYDVQRVKFEWELKRRNEILWAIGGAGMLNNYAPKEEGFTTVTHMGKKYYFADVWRNTHHIIIGFDTRGYLNIGFVTWQNYNEMYAWCYKTGIDPDNVILLDGGHIPAVNMPEIKYKTTQHQDYGILLNFKE